MHNSELIKQCENLNLFELWRLQCGISQLLEDPKKVFNLKITLRPGMEITYFDERENREIAAVVLAINKARVLVRNKHDGKQWNLPFYMLNINNVNPNVLAPTRGNLSKINFKVGDQVCWVSTKLNKEMFGKIVKLNPKYAKVQLADQKLWRVVYSLLLPVLDGVASSASEVLIEGEVLQSYSTN